MAHFGELLVELRRDKNMSQKDLAQVLYVTPGTISNYENGVHLPDIEKLTLIADYFDVTTDYLLGRCYSSLSPDILNQHFLEGQTFGELLTVIINLTPDRKETLAVILKDMKFGTLVNNLEVKDEIHKYDTNLHTCNRK